MSEFVRVLRVQVDEAQRALEQALRVGDDQQAHLRGARLLDLLDRASRHDVDTTGWVPVTTVTTASAAAGSDR